LSLAARRSAVALVDQAILSGTSFLTTVAIGRLAGEAELGVYAVGVSVALIVLAIQDSLILIPYTFFRERGERARAYAGSVFVQHALLAWVAGAALAIIGVVLVVLGRGATAAVAGALAVVVAGALVHEFARRTAFIHHRVGGALALDAASVVIQVGALVALALAGRLSAVTALLALGGARGLAGAARLLLVRASFDVSASDWRQTGRRHWGFARYDLTAQVVGAVEGYATYWILTLVRDSAETGILAAAMTVAMVANPILYGLHNVFVPRIADAQQRGSEEIWRIARQAAFLYVAVMGAFCAVMIAFGGTILARLYGPGFEGTGVVVAMLAILAVVGATELAAANGLRAFGRPDAHLAAGTAGLALVVVVGPPLCARWGVQGAAVTALAAGVLEAVVDWIWLGRLRRRVAPPQPAPSP